MALSFDDKRSLAMNFGELIAALETVEPLLAKLPNTGIVVYDTNYYFHFLAGPALANAGSPREQFYHKTLEEAVDDKALALLKPLFDRALAGGEGSLDFRGINQVDYRVHLFPIREEGRVVGAANLIVQTSTREFEMYREIIRNSPDGIQLLSPDGRTQWANQASINRLGESAETLQATPIYQLLHELGNEQAWTTFRDSLTPGGATTMAATHENSSAVTQAELNFSQLTFNNQTNTLLVSRDVSRLWTSEELLRQVITITNEGIWDWKPESNELNLSTRWKEILGFADHELANEESTFLSRIHPDDKDRAEQALVAYLNEGVPYRVELRLRHKDGSYREVLSRGAALGNPESAGIRIVGAIKDITEIKRRETELKRSLKEKSVLLGELHHRTKNNMQVIQSLLALRARRDPHPEVKRAFREVGDRIQAMAIVHQELYQNNDLSRIFLGTYLARLAGYMVRGYGDNAGTVQLQLSLDETLEVRSGTAMSCGFVLVELISNALKHAFPDNAQGHLFVTLSRISVTRAQFTVRDDGVGFVDGIAPETNDRLGLRSVRAIVESQLEGEMTLESNAGVQCRVTFNEKH